MGLFKVISRIAVIYLTVEIAIGLDLPLITCGCSLPAVENALSLDDGA